MRRACAIVVRAIALDAEGRKVPAVPASWSAQYEDNGWVTLRRDAQPGAFMHAWLACEASGSGAWVIVGPRAWVDAVAALASRAWATLADLRADGGAVAVAVKTAWLARHGAGTVVPVRMAGFGDDDAEVSA